MVLKLLEAYAWMHQGSSEYQDPGYDRLVGWVSYNYGQLSASDVLLDPSNLNSVVLLGYGKEGSMFHQPFSTVPVHHTQAYLEFFCSEIKEIAALVKELTIPPQLVPAGDPTPDRPLPGYSRLLGMYWKRLAQTEQYTIASVIRNVMYRDFYRIGGETRQWEDLMTLADALYNPSETVNRKAVPEDCGIPRDHPDHLVNRRLRTDFEAA